MEKSEPSTEVGKEHFTSLSQTSQNQTTTMTNEYNSFGQSMPRSQNHRNGDPQNGDPHNYKPDPYDIVMHNPYYGNVPELYNNPTNSVYNKPANGQYPNTSHALLPEQYNDCRLQERYGNPVEQFPPRFQQQMDGRYSFPANVPFQNTFDNPIGGQFQTQQFGPRISSMPDQAYNHSIREQYNNGLRYGAPISMNENIHNSVCERRVNSDMEQQSNFQQSRQPVPNTETERVTNPVMDYNRSIQERVPMERFTVSFLPEQYNYQQSMRYPFIGVNNQMNAPLGHGAVPQPYINTHSGRYNEPGFYNNIQSSNRFIDPRLGQNNTLSMPYREPFPPNNNFRPNIQRYPGMQLESMDPTFFQLPYMQDPIPSRYEPSSVCTNTVLSSSTPAQVFTTPACRPVISSLEKKSDETQIQIVRPTVPAQVPNLGVDPVPMQTPNLAARTTVPLQIPRTSIEQTPVSVIAASTVAGSSRDSKPTESANILVSQLQVVNPIVLQTISTEQQNVPSKTLSNTLKEEAEKGENPAGKEISDMFFRGKLLKPLQKEKSAFDFIGRESDHSFGEQFLSPQFSFSDSSASRFRLKSKVYPPIVGAKVAAVIIQDEAPTSESIQEGVKQSCSNLHNRNKFPKLADSKQFLSQCSAETLQAGPNPNHVSSGQPQLHTAQLTRTSSAQNRGKETSLENGKDILQESFDAVAGTAKAKLQKIHDGCEKLTSSDLLEILEISDEKLAVLELLYLKTVTKDSVFLSYDDVEAILSCNAEKQTSPGGGTLNPFDVDGCDTQQLQSSSHYPTVTGGK